MNPKRSIDANAAPSPFSQSVEKKNGQRMDERSFNFPESNPFSTRFTAPGKTPFFFERSFLRRMKAAHPAKFEEFFVRALGAGEEIRGSVCLQFLIDRFEANSRRGQLVGPHGSGKSTLLFALKEALTKRGYEIFSWSLHDQRNFLPDVFWLELQRFLQSTPAFLPVKCLLPPPIVSREEYWAQQRKELQELDADSDSNRNDGSSFDQFNVGTPSDESQTSELLPDKESASDSPRVVNRPEGFFGFNAAGNFGFNKRVAAKNEGSEADVSAADTVVSNTSAGSDNANALEIDSATVVPFPGVAPPNDDAEVNPSPASVDGAKSVPLSADTTATTANANDLSLPNETFAQKKLEIPLPLGFDLEKSRSFFEKKVVFFDGFEQLSYVNRIILRTFCRMNRLGLLLTTHSPALGIPVLFRSSPSVETLKQVLNYLLDDLDMTPDDADLDVLLKNFNGDVREILFSLYDAFENYRWAPQELRKKIARRYPR